MCELGLYIRCYTYRRGNDFSPTGQSQTLGWKPQTPDEGSKEG